MKNILLLSLLLISFVSQSQQSPTHYVDTTGTLYWRKSTPVYLFVSDAPDGESVRLKSKVTPQYADPFFLDTEGLNYIRSRNAVDKESMRIVPDTEVMYEIYADGIAPVTSISYGNLSKYTVDGIIYYQAGLTIDLEAKDQMSGVRKLEYAINNAPFSAYSKTLTFTKPGAYVVKFRSEDQVGNQEEVNTLEFTIDGEPPISDFNVNGITSDNVVATTSKMYFLSVDSLSGTSFIQYKFDANKFMKYNGSDLPLAELEEGEHTVTYFAEDFVGNKEAEQNFTFFLDKSAPLMVADVLGDRFIVDDEIYFSGRTKLKLTAVDNKVGVKEIMFSVDGAEFKKYDQPFYLPSISGVHVVKYYSVDNLQNSTADSKSARYIGQGGYEQFKHNVNKFYVDLTGPVINHVVLEYAFTRSDSLFIGPYSKIKLNGADPESGLKKLTYNLVGSVGEVDYTEPFNLAEEGYKTINYYGYDNVNNRNVAKFGFYLDATPPDIFIQFNTGSIESKETKLVYPVTSGIFLSATDKTSGVSSVTYSIDGSDFRSYAGLITKFNKGKHELVVKAKDFLNNEAIKEITFFIK